MCLPPNYLDAVQIAKRSQELRLENYYNRKTVEDKNIFNIEQLNVYHIFRVDFDNDNNVV